MPALRLYGYGKRKIGNTQDQYADVAELADALGSGPSGGNIVGVQVPSSAPKTQVHTKCVLAFLYARMKGLERAKATQPSGLCCRPGVIANAVSGASPFIRQPT
jgi:hypothetical protein